MPELLSHYQKSHCFVNPSLYEGMPNSILEAMACGLPVVATRVPGNDELVVHGETGLLFELNKQNHLGDSLLSLINDRDIASRMGKSGRNRALDKFTWRTTSQLYANLIDLKS